MSKVKPKVLGTVTKQRGRSKDPLAGFLDPADAIVPCACGAKEGEPCIFDPGAILTRARGRGRVTEGPMLVRPGTVHFSRRMKRLLLTAAKPHLREEFEAKAVAMLRDYLKEKARS